MIFQGYEQNMAWKKSINVLSHQAQNCFGTRSGGFWWGNLRKRYHVENLGVDRTTRPVFRYFTPLGRRNFCAPPPLFVRIQLCSVKQ